MKFEHFGLGAKCRYCGGSGKAVDHIDIGKWIKGARERKMLRLRDVAARSGLTVSYISDLEHGRRNWTVELFNRIHSAIEQNALAATDAGD